MPNNTGQFAERVEALRQRLEAAQVRLAGVAKQQNNLLESLARNELEQQKERIGTYQIQARFALAAIYDRAAAPPAAPKAAPQESQGELENVPADSSEQAPAPMDGAAPPPDTSTVPGTDTPRESAPTDTAGAAEDTPQAPK